MAEGRISLVRFGKAILYFEEELGALFQENELHETDAMMHKEIVSRGGEINDSMKTMTACEVEFHVEGVCSNVTKAGEQVDRTIIHQLAC